MSTPGAADHHLRELQQHGYTQIPNFPCPAQLARVNELLDHLPGYSIHPPCAGQLSAYQPLKALQSGFVPPAFERTYRAKQ